MGKLRVQRTILFCIKRVQLGGDDVCLNLPNKYLDSFCVELAA